ncbi:DUF7408 domain-containing protein [Ferviditalea candida]|uniref:DUF7408 domain-containing protein n=1 Tax=Ferviditalea candida TaxID=3108399 RepID=A0ABU5ZLY3_9BACL|nr:hypothetical protein [Paenibacillaceae bacterium T2]
MGSMIVEGQNKKRWSIFFSAIFILSAFFFLPLTIHAEDKVELSALPGIGGEYKNSQLVPVQVTLTNQGDDLEGRLVLEAANGGEFGETYYQPVFLAKGATKRVTLLVPGQNLNPGTYIRFYSGDQEVTKVKIGGRSLSPDTLFVGVLAMDPDTANFLGTLPKSQFPAPARVVAMKAEDVPSFSTPLKMLDILVINNFALDSLSREQIAAIADWTKEGGFLVLAGGAQIDKSTVGLSQLLPVEVKGTAELSALNSLSKAANKPLELKRPFTVSEASVNKGTVLYRENDIPLFVSGNAGAGKVLYAAYDLTEEPLGSWAGNSELWAQMLIKVNQRPFYQKMDMISNFWPLNNAVERIPSLKLPNVLTLGVLFAVYVLIIGPLLYIILKRREKREWIWWIVPVLAFVTAYGIYQYGLVQRGTNVLVHNVAFMDLDGTGTGDLSAATAIFVPGGGDYKLRFRENSMVLPWNQMRNPYDQQKVWVSISPKQAEIEYKDVEFWSLRKAFMQKSLPDAGKLVSDLEYRHGKLVGTVKNETRFALRDVKVVNGRHVQDIPVLVPGETAQVELSFDTNIQWRPGGGPVSNTYMMLPKHLQNQREPSREQFILDMFNTPSIQVMYSKQFFPAANWSTPVMMVGWTEAPVVNVEVAGEKTKEENLTLVKAELTVKPSKDGSVFLPAGTVEPVMTESSVQANHTGDGFMIPPGNITFEFNIFRPDLQFTIEKIQIYTWSNDGTRFDKQVYNWKTGKYEPFGQAFEAGKLLAGEQISSFVSKEGKLKIQFAHSADGYHHLGLPAISVEGKVIQK